MYQFIDWLISLYPPPSMHCPLQKISIYYVISSLLNICWMGVGKDQVVKGLDAD